MTVADRVYGAFPGQIQNADLATYTGALAGMFEYMASLMESGPNGEVGWSILLDVDRCPPEALSWLAQLVGTKTIPSLTTAQQRAYIKSKPGWQRGTPAAMVTEIQQYLTGSKRVIITERDTDAYHFSVLTFASETPSTALVNQAILAQKPAGLQYTYTTSSGGDYGYVASAYTNYGTLITKYATYDGLAIVKEGT